MVEAFAQRGLSRRRVAKLLGAAGIGLAASRAGLTSGAATTRPTIGSPEWRAPAIIDRQQTVNLQWFMWSGSPAEVDAWKHIAGLVTQQHPNIQIEFVTASWPDYWTKLPTEAAGGSLQDIISLQSLRTAGFADLFQPLTPYVQKDKFDVDAFDSSIIGGLTWDNDLRALPYDFGPELIFFNKDMFKAAGVAEPKLDWTYDDFLEAAKALTKDGKYGFGAWPYPDSWLPFALSEGATYLTADGKLDLTNDSLVAAFTKYTALVHEQQVAPQIPSTKDTNYMQGQWLAGNVAMSVDGPWQMINFKQQAKFSFGIVPVPKGSKGSVTISAGSGFGISKTTPHPDEVWQAISILTGPEAEQYLASAGRAFAARKDAQQYWYANAVEGSKEPLEAALKSVIPYKVTPQWQQVSTLLLQYGIPAMNGQASPKDALAQVQAQAGG
ncbi:MAG TPA: sugar ABC transporter substrate-binding protein [Thermomicrobiales bacterium]|nr:sugar ABC transporter substrate-binding protein [Thermomicrobiales bacterium]